MPARRHLLLVVWAAFLVRGAYYCAQQPLWEGLDEWANFAALQHFATHGRMPARTDAVSEEVVRSLELAPLAHGTASWVAAGVDHDEYWQLPAQERARRERELRALTASYRRPAALPAATQQQYEGQQPPLYSSVLAVPYLATRGWALADQVLLLRLLSLLLASLTIPLAFGVARQLPATRPVAIYAAAFLAAMPAFAIDGTRVGGHALAIPLIGAVLLCALRAYRRSTYRDWTLLGLALGAALLAKGYALAAVPLVPLAALLAFLRHRNAGTSFHRHRNAVAGGALALALALAVAAWWYAGNLQSTGTLAGEQMDVAAHAAAADKVAAVAHVSWLRFVDSAAMTHIWIGGWSFLLLRSWMYRVFELLALAALLGILRSAARLLRDPRFLLLAAAYASFCLAMAYFAVTLLLALHSSAGPGWYLNGAAVAEAALLGAGAVGLAGVRRARVCLAGATGLALALDMYSVHFLLLPYYTGQIHHRATGGMQAAALGQLTTGRPLWLWLAYLAADLALAGVVVSGARPACRRGAR